MKKIFFITTVLYTVMQMYSCDCDGDYIEEARSFDKDTALMFVWLYDESPANKDYLYYLENGDYRYGETINELKFNYQQVWYVKNNIIYYRGGGETACTVRENLFCKYKIINDSLFAYFQNEKEDGFLKTPKIYIKISKHP